MWPWLIVSAVAGWVACDMRKGKQPAMSNAVPSIAETGQLLSDGSRIPFGSVRDPRTGFIQFPDGSLHRP